MDRGCLSTVKLATTSSHRLVASLVNGARNGLQQLGTIFPQSGIRYARIRCLQLRSDLPQSTNRTCLRQSASPVYMVRDSPTSRGGAFSCIQSVAADFRHAYSANSETNVLPSKHVFNYAQVRLYQPMSRRSPRPAVG